MARLDDVTLANMALQLHINVSLNRPPDRTWRRPPGRPRNKWLDQLRNDSTRPIGELWRGVRSTVDMVVQRRDGTRWLRDHDDDDEGGGWRSLLAARFRDFCSCFPLKRSRIRCLETSKYTGKSLSGWGPEHTALLKLSCEGASCPSPRT